MLSILTQSHKALGALLSADIVDPTNEKLDEAWSAYKAGEEYLSGATDEVVSVLEGIRALETRDVHEGYDDGAGGGNFIYADYIKAEDVYRLVDPLLSRLSRAGDE